MHWKDMCFKLAKSWINNIVLQGKAWYSSVISIETFSDEHFTMHATSSCLQFDILNLISCTNKVKATRVGFLKEYKCLVIFWFIYSTVLLYVLKFYGNFLYIYLVLLRAVTIDAHNKAKRKALSFQIISNSIHRIQLLFMYNFPFSSVI